MSITKNITSPFLVNKKEFSIWKKIDTYNLMITDKNLLLNKNRRINKKIKLLPVIIQ